MAFLYGDGSLPRIVTSLDQADEQKAIKDMNTTVVNLLMDYALASDGRVPVLTKKYFFYEDPTTGQKDDLGDPRKIAEELVALLERKTSDLSFKPPLHEFFTKGYLAIVALVMGVALVP